jgi:predicted  nucleic acid-binding Zn-ribbon protein
MRIQHECTACGSEFAISYNEMNTESDPLHCPFCGEFLLLDDESFEDNDDDEEPL